jgi:hypothetical protein
MCGSRSALLVVALAGCNQLFGIKDTEQAPAPFYDGGIDAGRGCPPIGGTPDDYSPYVHQVFVADCEFYSTIPTGRAIQSCFATTGMEIHEGIAGAPLPPAQGAMISSVRSYDTPRLSPDGARMLVAYPSGAAHAVAMFVRQPDDTWVLGPAPGFGTDVAALSTMAHVPTGDRVLVLGADVTEWEYDGTGWSFVRTQFPQVFGQGWVEGSMTSDGLHLLLADGTSVVYTDRPDPSSTFRQPVPLAGVPLTSDLFLTDDCSRIYMSGLGALYYVEQN